MKNYIYLDIETVRGDVPPSRDEIKVPANYTKPETIEKYISDNLEDIWDKEALNDLKGQIVCIGFSLNDGPVVVFEGDEKSILEELEHNISTANQGSYSEYVVYNGLGFDLPYIWHKAIKHDLHKLKSQIPHEKFSKRVFDVMIEWAGTDYSRKVGMKDVAKFLGIPVFDGVDGSKVGQLWRSGEKQKVVEYCKHDVETLRAIHKKLI